MNEHGDGIRDDTDFVQGYIHEGRVPPPGEYHIARPIVVHREAPAPTLGDLRHLDIWRANESYTIRWPDGDLYMGPFIDELVAKHALKQLHALAERAEPDGALRDKIAAIIEDAIEDASKVPFVTARPGTAYGAADRILSLFASTPQRAGTEGDKGR